MNGIAIFDKNCTWNVKGGVSGIINLHQCSPQFPTQISVDLSVEDKTDSIHALHIHEYGNLLKGCMGAGGHYNPYNEYHGSKKHHGIRRHVGDLINNVKSSKGGIKTSFCDELVTLYGPNSVFGRTLVIHSGEDDLGLGGDEESLITGNAGGRMACAIIGHDKPGCDAESYPEFPDYCNNCGAGGDEFVC